MGQKYVDYEAQKEKKAIEHTFSISNINKTIMLYLFFEVSAQATFYPSLKIEAARNIDDSFYILVVRSIQEHDISSCRSYHEKKHF